MNLLVFSVFEFLGHNDYSCDSGLVVIFSIMFDLSGNLMPIYRLERGTKQASRKPFNVDVKKLMVFENTV